MRHALLIAVVVVALAATEAAAAQASSAPAGKFMVILATQPSPPVAGANQFVMAITDGGKPVSGAGVSVHIDMTAMAMPADFAATPGSVPGQYVADVNLSMAGEWKVTVAVRQMPGMTMAGDGEARFTIETGKAVTARGGGGGAGWLLPALAIMVALGLLFLALRSRGPARGIAAGILTILVVLVVTVLVVRKYRNPTVSTVIGSALMDMEAMKPAPGAVAVSVEVVHPAPFQAAVGYTGTVAADLEEDVFPRVMGRLAYMPFYPGDRIRAGEVVARLEARELEATARGAAEAVRAAESDVETAEQGLREAESGVGAARAAVTQAQSEVKSAQADVTYWKAELAREQHLYEVGAIAKEELDRETSQAATATAKLAQAKAGVNRAQAEVKQAEARRSAAGAAVVSAQAKVAQARAGQSGAATMQGYTELRASHDGVVTARNVAPGVVVQPGTSILRIAKTDYVRLQVNVAQADLYAVRIGQRMVARTLGAGGEPIAAPITDIFPARDPSTHTAVVEARVANPEGRLKLGEYLSVQLPLGAGVASVISVPNVALLPRAGETSVFIVKRDGARTVAQRVRVVTGRTSNTRTEILSGLREGDEVIVSGAASLNDGDAVKVISAATSGSRQ